MESKERTHEETVKLLESIYTDTNKIYGQIVTFEGSDEARKENFQKKVVEVITYCETMYDTHKNDTNVLKTLHLATKLLREIPKFKKLRKKINDRLNFLLQEYDKNKKSNES
jgi:hypothetical protein